MNRAGRDGGTGRHRPSAGALTSRLRRDIEYCLAPARLRRTVAIAVAVGTLLTLFNQGDVIVAGAATGATAVKAALNYVVPFVVSNIGMLGGRDTGES